MNNSTQAQKGFKTFLLTLSISLIVFSVIYFVITNNSDTKVNLDANVESNAQTTEDSTVAMDTDTTDDSADEGAVAGAAVGPALPTEGVRGPQLPTAMKDTAEEKPTVFGQIAAAKPNVQARAVLAATTSVGQSTITTGGTGGTGTGTGGVPNGGTESITVGLILSLAAFAFGMYVIYKDPRKMALAAFEKNAVRNIK